MTRPGLFKFPLYLLTAADGDFEAGPLDLGQFKSGKASWVTSVVDGQRFLLLFTSEQAILQFCRSVGTDPNTLQAIEMNREELAAELVAWVGKIQMVGMDMNLPSEIRGTLVSLLDRLRSTHELN
jgi:hypothetical protein